MRVEAHAAEALGPALAARVARDLAAAIAARGRAALAVPGGTTPAPFLTALGAMDLAWAQVTVTLTDERWVPAHDARSNQRLLGETLFAGQAAAASFVPLYTGAVEPAAAETVLSLSLQPMLPLDVVVLGMGADRHTASLFPGSPQLEAALAPGEGRHALAVTAPGQPEPRITLSAPVLSGARHVYLLIRGAGKRAALDAALAESDPRRAPIRAVLEAAHDTTV
ncbi:MAG: 6-phosphogluconolactonase, partial [Pseudomonadota bacterium]